VAAQKDGTRFGRLKTAGNGTLQLVIDYVKQETLEPLKGLGRFLLFGVIGSVFLGIGLVILAVAFLRFLQGETDGAFDGNLSWIPYLIVTVVVVAVAAAAVLMIQRGAARRQDSANAVDKEAA
jgi:hypothetical protein